MKKLMIVLVLILSGCGVNDEKKVEKQIDELISKSESSSFTSFTEFTDENYFYEQDSHGNGHLIDKFKDQEINIFNVDQKYYSCIEKCSILNTNTVEEHYKGKVSITDLELAYEDAKTYYMDQLLYIKKIVTSGFKNSISLEKGVYTVIYETASLNREVLVVDMKKNTLVYYYNGNPPQKFEFKLTEVDKLEVK